MCRAKGTRAERLKLPLRDYGNTCRGHLCGSQRRKKQIHLSMNHASRLICCIRPSTLAASVAGLLLALAPVQRHAGTENTGTGQGGVQYTTGSDDTGDGYAALVNNTNCNYNTVLGSRTLVLNTTGAENTAAGGNAMFENTTGLATAPSELAPAWRRPTQNRSKRLPRRNRNSACRALSCRRSARGWMLARSYLP